MLPRVRPLGLLQRKQQLRRVASFEVARLRKRAEPAAPEPIDDGPATERIANVPMAALVESRAA